MSSPKLAGSANPIGERIKARRLALKMSQTELANAIGFRHATTVSNYEKGQTPRGRILGKLSEVLGVTADWILTGTERPGGIAEPAGNYIKVGVSLKRKDRHLWKLFETIMDSGDKAAIADLERTMDHWLHQIAKGD